VRILLVRLRLIGDVVFTTPLIRALRRYRPDAHLAYIVEPAAAPVLHGNPHLNDLIVVPKRSGIQRLLDDVALGRRLQRERFDIAIDLHGGPRAAWLTWASGAPMRIGYTIKGRSWMYTHTVGRSPDLAPRHSVVNQWDLLAPLGIEACDPARDPVEMIEDTRAAARVERRLEDAGVRAGTPLVVIQMNADNPFRRWPEESFSKVVIALAQGDPNRRIVLTSGPPDREKARRISDAARMRLPSPESVLAVEGWDLNELQALIARASVYIGGDSGPLHVASTTRTPVVALLGPTLPERSRPWRDSRLLTEIVDAGPLPCRPCDQRHCAPGDFRCLTGISPERVLAAVEGVLRMGSGVK
jgi:lipopolysaccharide heptosyltransferase II